MTATIDTAIIGAGPAGLTAAMYCARAGLDCAVIEMLGSGGQMATTEHLENYPGFNASTSGFELAGIMEEQATQFGAKVVYDRVDSISFDGSPFHIEMDDGEIEARTVIIATGARPAKLGIEGEEEFLGSGVSYCATCDGNFFRDQDVCVIGGGDTAAADAIYLSRICKSVSIIVRRDVLRATAIYNEKLKGLDNVKIIWNSVVDRIEGEDGAVSGVSIRNVKTGETSTLACTAAFIAIGTVPNVEFLDGSIELDHTGHIVTDSVGATAVRGVYAAGDVRAKELYQVTTAVADGANAAEDAARFIMQSE